MSKAASDPNIKGILSSISSFVGAPKANRQHGETCATAPRDTPADAPPAEARDPESFLKPLRPGAPLASDKAFVLTAEFQVDRTPSVLHLRPEQKVQGPRPGEAHGSAGEPTKVAPCNDAEQDSHATELPHRTQDAGHLIEKITELETAIAKTADQWEPDDEGRDAYAGTPSVAMDWRDDVSLDGTGVPVGMAEPARAFRHAPEPEDTRFADEQVLDEDALRALVAEVVREELRGDIGQQLSRNLRKLVRQEISRALAAERLS